jgi:hypothetical protein
MESLQLSNSNKKLGNVLEYFSSNKESVIIEQKSIKRSKSSKLFLNPNYNMEMNLYDISEIIEIGDNINEPLNITSYVKDAKKIEMYWTDDPDDSFCSDSTYLEYSPNNFNNTNDSFGYKPNKNINRSFSNTGLDALINKYGMICSKAKPKSNNIKDNRRSSTNENKGNVAGNPIITFNNNAENVFVEGTDLTSE